MESACLIFAHDSKEARLLAWRVMCSWFDVEWTDVATRLIRDGLHLYADADAEKLAAGKAHAIECPTVCVSCEMWGSKLDERGICEECIADHEESAHTD